MIVRTYGRRSRSIARTCSDTSAEDQCLGDPVGSQETSQQQDVCGFGFSSQGSISSSPWAFDSTQVSVGESERGGEVGRKVKKARNGKAAKVGTMGPPAVTATATLMETQEFGEMMEHVDEVNFALDGLRMGQPVRIKRASLLSLLSICDTVQRRRLLRTQGMAKTIIDAVLGLSLDDSPSNLAAAALFYVLTCDGQEEHLLESPSCIRFLLKILKPIAADSSYPKPPTIGCKLLALHKDHEDIKVDAAKRSDSSLAAIVLKVQEIFVKCKELSISELYDNGMGRPELSPKWIALLTMEKASLSTISLEETSGTMRKTGGNFKEKLREFGGLDAIFDVALNCYSILEGKFGPPLPLIQDIKDDPDVESLVILLKFLKIMENATFLSKDNQNHLLGMRGKLDHQELLSFTELIIRAIKIFSGLFLNKTSAVSDEGNSYNFPDRGGHTSDMALVLEQYQEGDRTQTSSKCIRKERIATEKSLSICQNNQWLSSVRLGNSASSSEASAASLADSCLLKMRIDSSTSGSCSVTSRSSSGDRQVTKNGSMKNIVIGKRPVVPKEIVILKDSEDPFAFDEDENHEIPSKNGLRKNIVLGKRPIVSKEIVLLEDSEDPFAFDEDDKPSKIGLRKNFVHGKRPIDSQEIVLLEDSEDPFAFDEDEKPSKWDLLSGKQKASQSQKSMVIRREPEDRFQTETMMSQQESSNCDSHHSREVSHTAAGDEEIIDLLANCLLTAVKVLMNLTNDNPDGCQQIASSGGLETMSLLIACHFPMFSSSSSSFRDAPECNFLSQSTVDLGHQEDRHLTERQMDFLVSILGLLVNLVEKDGYNRSRLAAASVLLPKSGRLNEENRSDVIPLLCAIFLANQGAGEAVKEENLDDELAVLLGEKEAEKTIIEAYAALLLAFLSMERSVSYFFRFLIPCSLPLIISKGIVFFSADSKSIRNAIADRLPEHNMAILVPVLERFLAFHLTLEMISPETHIAVSEVIESCRVR